MPLRHQPTTPTSAPEGSLTERYQAVRGLTEALAAPLGPEDQTVQTMADVSPTKWHRAHVTWFFETFLLQAHQPGYQVHDEHYCYLFNSYYEAVGSRHPRPERGLLTRPTTADVGDYRQAVDQAMGELLSGEVTPEVAALVTLGLHHEQQHQELLLMDIKHVLGSNPLRPAYALAMPAPAPEPEALSWIDGDTGIAEIGHEGPGFAYDNEHPRHEVLLRPHRLADRLVTNREWQAFIDDGGYSRSELWMSDGWATVQAEGWDSPLYWERVDGQWHEYTLAGRYPLDPGRPVVHVSHHEADAYARWAGARLPREDEWDVAVARQDMVVPRFELDGPHPRPPAGDDAGPLRQAFGEVWQWSSSAYLGYPGFVPAAGAVGEYNGKFMSGQMVLRGSSCATPPGHARPSYRNFFPPTARWAFSGVRLAADV